MNQTNIPNILIRFWHEKSTFPMEYEDAFKRTMASNSDFTVKFVDDAYILDYLEHKDTFLFEFYKNIQIPAIRSDIASLVLLYEYGGIYMDMAIELHKPLSSIINTECDVVFTRRDDQPQYTSCPEEAHACLAIIASTPQSSFIKCCLYRLVNKLIEGRFNTNVILATTQIMQEVYQYFQTLNHVKSLEFCSLSFKSLKKESLTHIRIRGLQNSWKPLEKEGILKPSYLELVQKNFVPYTSKVCQ